MFKSLVTGVFEALDEPLPPSFEKTIIITHQREGAMNVLDELIAWEPKAVADAKKQSGEQGKPVEDDNEN